MIKIIKANEAAIWEAPTHGKRRASLYFSREITPTKNLVAGYTVFPPYAEKDKADAHEKNEEIYYVLNGKGKFIIDDKEYGARSNHPCMALLLDLPLVIIFFFIYTIPLIII